MAVRFMALFRSVDCFIQSHYKQIHGFLPSGNDVYLGTLSISNPSEKWKTTKPTSLWESVFSNKNQVAQSVVKNSNLKLCFLRHSFQFQMRLHSKTARLTQRDVHRAPQPSQPSGETAGWSPATFLPGRPVFFENQKGATETEETTTTKIGQILLQKPRLVFETLILKIDMWVHFFKLFSNGFFSLLIRRKYKPCFQEVGRSTFLLLEMMFLRVPTIRKFSKRFSNVASQFLLQQQRSFLPKKRYPLVN